MKESVLVRIDSEDPARLWSGVGDLFVSADQVEPEDSIYLGGPQLISIPDFQALINGTAERLTITVNGVTAEVVQLALEESASVKGARVDIGTIRFDDAWQPLGEIEWESRFRADVLNVDSQPGDAGRVRSITISIGSDDTARSRAPIAFFTPADQKRRSPTDNFFDHVPGITVGTSRRFGPS
jgi:hypothetical protein